VNTEVTILIAEDDEGHARLIERNLRRAALNNRILRFGDGQEVLDFFAQRDERVSNQGQSYLLLLDIRMPKLDGIEVLRQLKQDPCLRKMPVLMLTTMDDPQEVARCHTLGCSHYIVKPVEYDQFTDAMSRLGKFVTLVRVPELKPEE
jgi:CheY-like chemotaxis protein